MNTAMRAKRYTAYVQWNARKRFYAGYVPGIPDTEAFGESMEELKDNLRRVLAGRLRERRSRSKSAPPRSGFQRIDVRV